MFRLFGARGTSKKRCLYTLTAMLLLGMVLPVSAQEVDNPFTSYFVETAPVVDGTISPGEYPGSGVTISTANSFNVDWGGANPQVAPEDCSFTVYSAWTNEALYFAIDVTDDDFGLSDDGWTSGDFVQIVLAQVGAQARQAGSLADFADTSDGAIWRNNAGGGDIDWGNANITPEFAATANGYVFEVSIPWSDFNINLPTLEDGAQLKCMITVVDVDPGKEGAFNAFVISSGGPSGNPFENHQDISLLTLVQEDPAEPTPLVWDFCDGLQGWFNANQSPVAWDGSRMVVNQAAVAPGTYDPHIAVGGLSHDLETFPELAIKMTVENAPRAFNIGVFSFREGAAHIRPQFSGVNNGEHILRLNYLDAFPNEETWTLTQLRLDIPDNEPHVDGGAWPDFQDMVVTIDWVALTDDPDFEAGPCPVVVNISGPGMVVQGNNVTLWADVTGNVGDVTYQWWKDGAQLPGETNSYLELLSVTMQDSGQYAVAVTDDNDTVIVTHNLNVVEALPITGYLGLILLVVAASMSGFVLLRRQTT